MMKAPTPAYDFSRFSEIFRVYETGIYGVVNASRGSVYVGATKRSFRERWDSHRMALDSRTHFNLPLQRDWLRDGSNQFAFLILDELPASKLLAHFEQGWIDGFHQAGVECYNTARANEGTSHPLPPSIALPGDQEWLVVEEVADNLRVSVRTVLRWIEQKELLAVFLQGRHRISLDVLKAFMQKDRHKNPRHPPPSRPRRLSLCDVVVYERDSRRVDQIAGHNLPWQDEDFTAATRLRTVLGHISDRYAAAITDANAYHPGDLFVEATA